MSADFEITGNARIFEADIDRTLGDIEPTYRRLASRGRIPSAAAVIPFSDENVAAMLALHVECIPCEAETARRRLAGDCGEYNYCRQTSRVLTLSGRVIGFFLTFPQTQSGEVFIYGVAVAKPWRGTWATALLKYLAIAALRDRGASTLQFRAASTSIDTLRHAARIGARAVERC